MNDRGYVRLGRVRGSPFRVHWTAPIGALLFSGWNFAPGAWLAFFLVVLAHEEGHAVLIRAFGLRPLGIDIHGAGGECRYAGEPTAIQEAVIAWGGVLGQLLLLVVTAFLAARFEPGREGFAANLVQGLCAMNLLMAVFNLLPFAPFDGRKAWGLFPALFWKARRRAISRRLEHTRIELEKVREPRRSAIVRQIKPAVVEVRSRKRELEPWEDAEDEAELLKWAERVLKARREPTDPKKLN